MMHISTLPGVRADEGVTSGDSEDALRCGAATAEDRRRIPRSSGTVTTFGAGSDA